MSFFFYLLVSLQRSQSLPESMSWWQRRLNQLLGEGEAEVDHMKDIRKRSGTFPRASKVKIDMRPPKEIELHAIEKLTTVTPSSSQHTQSPSLNIDKHGGNTPDDLPYRDAARFYQDIANEWPSGRSTRECKSASPILQHSASEVNMSEARDTVSSTQSPPYTPSRTNSVVSNPSEEQLHVDLGVPNQWSPTKDGPLSPLSISSEDWTLYPNAATLKPVPVRINSEGEEDAIEHGEEGLVKICAGVYTCSFAFS